jgi:16S rRNA (cytosine967-C5)-methyltransferase
LKLHRVLIEEAVNAIHEIFTTDLYADKVIEKYLRNHRNWGSRDRKFFAESVYDIVRWWRALTHQMFKKDLNKPTPRQIWLIWAVWWKNQGNAIPNWEEFSDFPKDFDSDNQKKIELDGAIRESYPQWLWDRGLQEVGERWPQIAHKMNEQADVFLRVNTLRASNQEVLQELRINENIECTLVKGFESCIQLDERRNVFSTKAFHEGLFEVQDAASQHIAPFVEVEPGQRVIDACAGAGGKSLHLACLMRNKGKIIAMDLHNWKLEELSTRAKRNKIDIIETRVIESSKTIKRLAETADRVLLDVPCSGVGVLRRNPDAKWKIKPEEIDRLVKVQAEILESYSRMVKPGGKLVYATCSIFKCENQDQIDNFLSKHGDKWILEESMTLDPDKTGFDGFFAARLKRLPK